MQNDLAVNSSLNICNICSRELLEVVVAAQELRYYINSRIDEHASDDGEPKGSAGLQILNQLKRNELVNSATFVARIFGGTLLGVPGLIDSYSNASLISIDNAQHTPWKDTKEITFSFGYKLKGLIDSVIKEFNVQILNQKFGKDVSMNIAIDKNDYKAFINRVNERTSSQVKFP